jgi:hypothetical protein
VGYPTLTESQAADLALVERSIDGSMRYAPCQVTLKSGEVVDRVYVVDAPTYMAYWGIDPNGDRAKRAISIEDVARIVSSPVRLPAHLASLIYAEGESGMGYTIFTVVSRDGGQLPYVGGNAIDFPMWPTGCDPADVVGVRPHVGREAFRDRRVRETERVAPYFWCLYSV